MINKGVVTVCLLALVGAAGCEQGGEATITSEGVADSAGELIRDSAPESTGMVDEAMDAAGDVIGDVKAVAGDALEGVGDDVMDAAGEAIGDAIGGEGIAGDLLGGEVSTEDVLADSELDLGELAEESEKKLSGLLE